MLLIMLWLATAFLSTLSACVFFRLAHRLSKTAVQPACAVLSPVKGVSPTLDRYVAALLGQDYPRFRVVFIVESTQDPAHAALAAAVAKSAGRASLLIAGLAVDRGQKVHNLARAVERLEAGDELVILADADMEPAPDWLTQLTRPLALGRADLATGYLLALPTTARLPNLAASLVSVGLAGTFAPAALRLCWGGSTAIRRSTLQRLDPALFWAHTISDDLSLTRAAHQRGVAIHASLAVRAPSPIDHSWASLLDYGRRQYRLVRIHVPWAWAIAAWTVLVPIAGAGAAIVLGLGGHPAALGALVVAWLLQQVRLVLRRKALTRLLEHTAAERLGLVVRHGLWAAPIVHLVHALVVISSAWGRTITWAGITYRLAAGGRTTRVER